ncbi:hypothetical protein D3C80_1332530 [compost metagenome]
MHVPGAFRRPQQGRVAGEAAGVLKHLDTPRAVDPDDAVIVFGHLRDQLRQQAINHPLAFLRAFENGERRQVSNQPPDTLLGRGGQYGQCGQ